MFNIKLFAFFFLAILSLVVPVVFLIATGIDGVLLPDSVVGIAIPSSIIASLILCVWFTTSTFCDSTIGLKAKLRVLILVFLFGPFYACPGLFLRLRRLGVHHHLEKDATEPGVRA